MILTFPDSATLSFVLTSSPVLAEAAVKPAVAGQDEQGRIWLEPSVTLSRTAQTELRRRGVEIGKRRGNEDGAEISCWLEMLSLQKDATTAVPPPQAAVLFELPDDTGLARLAVEMLRLGNDRQTYCILEHNGERRALLRVVGPPYYSLLRATDRRDKGSPRAYLERSAHVWVELGWIHPFAGKISPPPGEMILLRAPRQWRRLPELPFHDVHEVLSFNLPAAATSWREGQTNSRYPVALRMTRGTGVEPAELWILRDDALNELNHFVQNADDHLVSRLAFTVAEHADRTMILLRVRPSKLPPPVLVLKAESYRPYLRLPNLFMPVGARLHPPLRRDLVRKLLAEDANVLTWLRAEADGSFVPETLPQDAFRPLSDWIEYVIDHDRESLQTWVQSHAFDFESFVCSDDEPTTPRKPPGQREREAAAAKASSVAAPAAPTKLTSTERPDQEKTGESAPVAVPEPSQLKRELQELEDRFLALDGPLDQPERIALWPQLAHLNAMVGHHDDAGMCWQNVLWSVDDWPEELLRTWFIAEQVGSRFPLAQRQGYSPDELDRMLKLADPTMAEVRGLAAYLVWAAHRDPISASLVARAHAVGRFLETHEHLLSVRSTWMAWKSLARMSGGDVLALARARDRLLERLFQGGLRPEIDVPSFLRLSGVPAAQRTHGQSAWLQELCEKAHAWVQRKVESVWQPLPTAQTPAYVDLIFAYGLARLGETAISQQLLDRALEKLEQGDLVHRFLGQAFKVRIQQGRAGKPLEGPLPAPLVEDFEEKLRTTSDKDTIRHLRFAADRLRQYSRILAPNEQVESYVALYPENDIRRRLAELGGAGNREHLAEQFQHLLQDAERRSAREDLGEVLRAALNAGPRIGEDYSLGLLTRAMALHDSLVDSPEPAALGERVRLLERSLFVAAHFDRREHVQEAIERFRRLLESLRGGPTLLDKLDGLVAQCFRGLRKLGMREDVDGLLRLVADVILDGQGAENVDPAAFADWPARLRVLLQVAAGWLWFGSNHAAETMLNQARTLLFSGPLKVVAQFPLAQAYISTAGQLHRDHAKLRLDEIFQRLDGIYDTFQTKSHYALYRLAVVERVMLAAINEDNLAGGRRWLDDDEFIVRRRIHCEFQAVRGEIGTT